MYSLNASLRDLFGDNADDDSNIVIPLTTVARRDRHKGVFVRARPFYSVPGMLEANLAARGFTDSHNDSPLRRIVKLFDQDAFTEPKHKCQPAKMFELVETHTVPCTQSKSGFRKKTVTHNDLEVIGCRIIIELMTDDMLNPGCPYVGWSKSANYPSRCANYPLQDTYEYQNFFVSKKECTDFVRKLSTRTFPFSKCIGTGSAPFFMDRVLQHHVGKQTNFYRTFLLEMLHPLDAHQWSELAIRKMSDQAISEEQRKSFKYEAVLSLLGPEYRMIEKALSIPPGDYWHFMAMLKVVAKHKIVTQNVVNCMIHASCDYRFQIVKCQEVHEKLNIDSPLTVYTQEQWDNLLEERLDYRAKSLRFVIQIRSSYREGEDGKFWEIPGHPDLQALEKKPKKKKESICWRVSTTLSERRILKNFQSTWMIPNNNLPAPHLPL
jgi:hypothetical protein